MTSLTSVPGSLVMGRSLPYRVALLDVNTSYHKRSFSLFIAMSVISEANQTSLIFISLTTFQIDESNDIHFKPKSSDIQREVIGRKKAHCMQLFQISSCLGIKSPFICLEPNSFQGTLLSFASFTPQDLCEKSISSPLCRWHLGGSGSFSDLIRPQVLNSGEFNAEHLRPKASSCHFLFLPDPTLPLPIPVAEQVF